MWRKILKDELTPFDFIKAASETKEDLIHNADYPELIEKEYNPYITNKAFSMHSDTILHANEMNQRAHVFQGAQFQYYRTVLRKRKRFSKWHKAQKDKDLDLIQEIYSCNRTVAKLYFKALSSDDIKKLHLRMTKGG